MPHSHTPLASPALTARPLLPQRLPLRLQDLPPTAARFCLRVGDFLTGELPRGATPDNGIPGHAQPGGAAEAQPSPVSGLRLVIGVSGGADSLCLLLVLRWLAPRLGLRLHAAVLDHGLRPESADEARAVAALCRRLGVPCRAERADVSDLAARECCGLEDAGRRARYAFFEAERQRTGADWTCTAHQADDLCEDVLLRLVRGTGWPGLGGMAAMDPARRILRPLLTTERRDIDAFLADLGVQPVRDPSNADPAYRRNRLRHQVLPLLRAENPALGEAVRSLWELARCDADYWSRHLAHAQAGHADGERGADAPPRPAATHGAACATPPHASPVAPPQCILLPGRTLRGLHRAARLRLYKRMLDRLGPGQPLAASLMDLDAAWHAGRGGACVQFPGGKTARVIPVSDSNAGCREDAGGIEFRASAPLPDQQEQA
ncbi:tRNA lysidine(34) synthetase TilS [Nitratidesulfovibrio sp. SRB-5]|uniref:tRNA lysidine(34) synthetase TilS n=1 Tax=Nitratidesulfovibrio sp. SRB-5 TaxID=2872636 RepID=UPI001CBB8CC3|nr:tRNA lysidine(34) synthetase TilS [Nitratidesulfovibrio sp. SRB-5]MBZ2171678.1 tRNA lysidine(34) synthetase TilS [Nitratidesulfovibrio sp. SRB-5]